MSETPRTQNAFAIANLHENKRMKAIYDEMAKLERELAEARKDAANQRSLADMALAHRDAIITERDTLEEAAQAVVDRWDAPTWKDLEPTAKFMNALREALAAVKGGQNE